MDISFQTQPAPSIPEHLERELLSLYPKVFMIWNPRYRRPGVKPPLKGEEWDTPRWEIWSELVQSYHANARNQRLDSDVWNTDHQCWMRRLQVYENADGSFAPVDERLLVGLELADGWKNRRLYEEGIEDPYEAQEEARKRVFMEAAAGSASYFSKLDSTIVGRHANSGWRHKIR